MIPKRRRIHLSCEEFEDIVEQALAGIPVSFAQYLANIVIEVEETPDQATVKSLGLRSNTELLGLYHGVPLTDRSVSHSGQMPDRITIYQRNIERVVTSRCELIEQVRKTVLHEIGHHFGLDEDDLFEAGYG